MLIDAAGLRHSQSTSAWRKRVGAEASLTETGQPVGTPRYMAPEQAAGRKDLTVAADVYSLGVILYERLTGRPPFVADNMLEVLRQVREVDPPRPSSFVSGLNRNLETICLKCLEKDPGRRYASAEAMSEDLDHWLKGEPIAARPVGRLEKTWFQARRNPALATAGSLAAVGLMAVAVISSIAAFQAQARARAERELRQVADSSRDKIEQTFARSLARPLNPEDTNDTIPWIRLLQMGESESFHSVSMSKPEVVALWELTELADERLRSDSWTRRHATR